MEPEALIREIGQANSERKTHINYKRANEQKISRRKEKKNCVRKYPKRAFSEVVLSVCGQSVCVSFVSGQRRLNGLIRRKKNIEKRTQRK